MSRVFQYLHVAFHQPRARAYRVTEGLIWALIALSLVNLAVELSVGPALQEALGG